MFDGMTNAEMNQASLEMLLTYWLRGKEPGPFAEVLITDDGQFAVLNVGNKQVRRKLSEMGREYLRTGGHVLKGEEESFLEPE